MNKKYLSGIALVFFLVLSIPIDADILCFNNSTSVINIAEICINLTNEPCISCTVNMTLFNPISSTSTLTINHTTLLNESGRGWYNTSFSNPQVLGRYPLFWSCNDSENVYGEYTYDILEVMDTCPGELDSLDTLLHTSLDYLDNISANISSLNMTISEINETLWDVHNTLNLNWSQLWDYFNCTNATSDLNDICKHLNTIISDIADVADDIEDVEDTTENIESDVRKIKIATQPKVTGWSLVGNWIMQNRYYILLGIGVIIFLVIIVVGRNLRKKSNEWKEQLTEEEGLGPEEEGF